MKFIAVEDFDNAVKQPRTHDTCILAQAVARMRRESLWTRWFGVRHWSQIWNFPNAGYVQRTFDRFFKVPGDEQGAELQALRAMLPLPLQEAPSVRNAPEKQRTPLINPK